MKKSIFICLIIAGLSACHDDQKEQLLKEAFGYYSESDRIHLIVETKLDSLEKVVITQKLPATDSLSLRVTALKSEFKAWQETFFEVPGYEHAHTTEDHHHHEHKTMPDLTPGQMVSVQKEILDHIQNINIQLSGLN
jgi:hypothetical protein